MDYQHKPHEEVKSDSSVKPFCLTQLDCLGWDLDHTLIRYNLKNLYELIRKCFLSYLVEKVGYPEEVLKYEINYEISKKGIVLDRDLGNLLKVNYASRIVVGYHGSRKLTEEELVATYGPTKDTGFSGSSTQRYWSLTTYFEAPIGSLYTSLIDLHERNKKQPHEVHVYNRDYRSHAEALFDALMYNFAEWGKGGYFSDITIYPERYLIKQPNVRKWLVDLRQKHKKFLFLLTNSLPEYTNVLMNYSFGTDWVQLFDIVSVHAQKPTWFTGTHAYYSFQFKPRKHSEYPGQSDPILSEVSNLKLNGHFITGNSKMLVEFFSKQKKLSKPLEVVYFGDHLRNDVQISKTYMKWKTVAIVEELEDAEIEMNHPSSVGLKKGCTNSNHPSDNSIWGSFFLADSHLTYWANEAAEHSDLMIPSLERLASFPCDTVFSASNLPSVSIKDMIPKK